MQQKSNTDQIKRKLKHFPLFFILPIYYTNSNSLPYQPISKRATVFFIIFFYLFLLYLTIYQPGHQAKQRCILGVAGIIIIIKEAYHG